MKRRVVVRSQASDELSEAFDWYKTKSPVVATGFRTIVRQTIIKIAERPASFSEMRPGIRRALTPRFPYAIFFAEEPSVVVILAIKHQAQNPASWPTVV